MTRWPVAPDPRDPFPEPLLRDRVATPLDDALADLWAGRRDQEAVAALLRDAGLDGPPAARRRPLPVAPWLPTEADLLQIATGADPAAGNTAPDLVLGPWADEPIDRRSRVIATALGAFFAGDEVVGAPWKRWQANRPPPPRIQREGVRAVAQAPLALWRIEARDGDRVQLADVLGLAPVCVPEGSVALRPPGLARGDGAGEGTLLAARVVPTSAGWVAACPLCITGLLPEAVARWVRWLTWADRVERPVRHATLAGVLARRGHVLVRRVLEHRWART